MAKKLSELSTESAPASTDIIGIADPTTGLMKKITVSALKSFMDSLFGDVTAPTVVSATVPNAAPGTIVVVFSESVTVTTTGWSFKKNGSAWSVSSVSGSGTTHTFTMGSTASSGDTILRTYAALGGCIDGSGNEMSPFTDSGVTNDIVGGTLVDLTFATNTGTLTNTSQVFSSSDTSAGGYNITRGLDAKKLPASTDGYIQMQYVSGGNAILGFNTANSNDNPTSYEAAAYLEGADLYEIDGGTITSLAYTMTSGHYVRVNRTGSTLKIQTSPDQSTWTDRATLSFSSSADLFICCAVDSQSFARLHYPKGFNVA